jgi:sporulation protein YlmC with PRC-barrel domain
MTAPLDRLQGSIDGSFHLMDRQLIDADGRFLGKVDDVELTLLDDGWTITALLTGTPAWLGRLGGRLGDGLVATWRNMRPSEPDRARPWRLPMELVDRLDSAVLLDVRRDAALRRDTEAFRLGSLVGMEVLEPGGRRVGKVIDARFEPGDDGAQVLRWLLVGRGGPGSLLGYERRREQGPWLVCVLLGAWHRNTRIVGVDRLTLGWNTSQVQLHEPLESASRGVVDVG